MAVEKAKKMKRSNGTGIGHHNENLVPRTFCVTLLPPDLVMLPIPGTFRTYLDSVPGIITIRTNTGCTWDIELEEFDGRVILNEGWPAFVTSHQIKTGYLLIFKKEGPKDFRIILFDDSQCEVVEKCPQHHKDLRKIG